MSEQWRLVFLGGGQMAEAIARGVIAAGLLKPEQIAASEVRAARREYLQNQVGIQAVASNAEAVALGDVILLAVKPQDTATVLADIGGLVTPSQVVVSIAAGVPLKKLEAPFTRPVPVVRVMPNTPCLVGAGMAAIARGTHASADDEARVLSIFNATGKAVSVAEKDLDAVTGLSGSGPGYVAVIVEAMIDGGVRAGLARDIATTLAVQTVLGSAQMLSQTGEHPARLKDMVTSPGGTTIAGVHALEQGGLRAAMIDAIVAATDRSRELGS
ncbi:MAG: pyrroline-5-carboxylate reductase [Chloroflexi bacterium]|nr:pyrroline-5-carboxylate reductase [Chloroflexota bacterium]